MALPFVNYIKKSYDSGIGVPKISIRVAKSLPKKKGDPRRGTA